ncbi:hypothetical protein LPJ53_001486 [Coemansia erecta]|uniref:Hexosyltransferase n=1 Tax=Coemansia erecta TaxID=147472 RepID=A0A9W8CU09_9FUNG|nr:hypothetical protein LPJ53_001486 [Coemansia erecta]
MHIVPPSRAVVVLLTMIVIVAGSIPLFLWYTASCQPEVKATLYQRKTDKSLAVVMPMNCNTDHQFYSNMWMGDYLHPVCDYRSSGCAIYCNQASTYDSLAKKTICFTRVLKNYYNETEFFIKLDDDALVDRNYIFGLMDKYKGYKKPLYISEFSTYHNSQPLLDGTRYGNGKFYMFNRKLLDCIARDIDYLGPRNEDAIFGAMVRLGCGEGVKRVPQDNSKVWHREYISKNKRIDMVVLRNH